MGETNHFFVLIDIIKKKTIRGQQQKTNIYLYLYIGENVRQYYRKITMNASKQKNSTMGKGQKLILSVCDKQLNLMSPTD